MDRFYYEGDTYCLGNQNMSGNSHDKSVNLNEELGFSGVEVVSGQIEFEYQKDLRNPEQRNQIYRKMRSDGSVDTALSLIELPLMSQTANVIAASSEADDQLRKDFIYENVLSESNISSSYTYKDHISEEVKVFQYGHNIFEIVTRDGDWIAPNGKTYHNMKLMHKLAMRHPISIEEWVMNYSSDVGLDGVKQKMPYGDVADKMKIGDGSQIYLPIDKLVIYTTGKEGDNWEGTSVLRALYKHWWFKELYYKLEAVGLQKAAMSIPVLYMDNPTGKRLTQAKAALRSLMAHEEAYMILNMEREKLDVHTAGIQDKAMNTAIKHHDGKILQSVLAGFMLLGQESRGGARSLGAPLIEFFMMAMRSRLDSSVSIKNRYLVKKLIDANFTNVRKYPIMTAYCGRISDLKEMSEILDKLASSGYVQASQMSIREYVHVLFGLPAPEDIQEGVNLEVDEEDEPNEGVTNNETELSILAGLPGIASSYEFEKFRKKWVPRMKKLVNAQKVSMSKQISDYIKKGGIPSLGTFELPMRELYHKMVFDYFDKVGSCYNLSKTPSEVYDIILKQENAIKQTMLSGVLDIAEKNGQITRI